MVVDWGLSLGPGYGRVTAPECAMGSDDTDGSSRHSWLW
ncbi:hypothetical protein NOCA240053 [metagenome]|uniref:Uncharacterized protein n=1 Tax=metagenome TaxID=256318 RepID=A0A2P2C5N4_9ZZZZ